MTPRTVAHQPLLFMGFSRQEYWSGLPCPPLGDLPDSGIKSMSPEASALQVDSLLSNLGNHIHMCVCVCMCVYMSVYTYTYIYIYIYIYAYRVG